MWARYFNYIYTYFLPPYCMFFKSYLSSFQFLFFCFIFLTKNMHMNLRHTQHILQEMNPVSVQIYWFGYFTNNLDINLSAYWCFLATENTNSSTIQLNALLKNNSNRRKLLKLISTTVCFESVVYGTSSNIMNA